MREPDQQARDTEERHRHCHAPGNKLRRAPRGSKDSFALIPAVRVAGDPEATQ